jgi:hypothetical protein
VTTPGTDQEFKAFEDFNGKRKCSFMWYTSADNTKAPAFKLTQSDFTDFQMQWSEWDNTAMTTGAFLPAVDPSPQFIGAYSAAKPWPNPVTQAGLTNWPATPLMPILESGGNPAYTIPGDIGLVSYYPYQTGPF